MLGISKQKIPAGQRPNLKGKGGVPEGGTIVHTKDKKGESEWHVKMGTVILGIKKHVGLHVKRVGRAEDGDGIVQMQKN